MKYPSWKSLRALAESAVLSPWAIGIAIASALFFPYLITGGAFGATFLAREDLYNLWYPQLVQSGHWYREFVFSGIDYFTHGGATEFFLRPNLISYDPLAFLLSFGYQPHAGASGLRFFFMLYVIHTIWGARSLFLLVDRDMGYGRSAAFFVTAGYFLSATSVYSIFLGPFFFLQALFPVVLQAMISHLQRPNLVGSVSVFWGGLNLMLAGYIPLSAAMFAASLVFSLLWVFFIRQNYVAEPAKDIQRRLVWFLFPPVVLGLVLLPLFIAFVSYFALVRPEGIGLNEAANSLALLPQYLLNEVSPSIQPPASRVEDSLMIGLIPLTILVWSLWGSKKTIPLTKPDRRLVAVGSIVLVVLVLSSWGIATPLAEAVYYLVPAVGKMHLYQRHLLWGVVFLWLILVVLIRRMEHEDLNVRAKGTLAIAILLVAGLCLYFSVRSKSAADVIVQPQLIVEVVYLGLFSVLALKVTSNRLLILAGVLISLTALQTFWAPSYGTTGSEREDGYRSISFDPGVESSLVDYLQKNSNGEIIKVVNAMPNWWSKYIPKNYPWLLREKLEIFDYYGYEQHVGTPLGYASNMTYVNNLAGGGSSFRPWWDWIHKTDGNFIFFDADDPNLDPRLMSEIDLSKALILKKGYTVAPLLRYQDPAQKFSNGVVRISGGVGVSATVSDFSWNRVNDIRLTVESSGPVVASYLFWPNRTLKYSIDGHPEATVRIDGLDTLTIPSGKHQLRIYYENKKIVVSVGLIGLTSVACFFVAVWTIVRRLRRGRP